MAMKLSNTFFGLTPFTLSSAYSVDESLKRLCDTSFRSQLDATLDLKEAAIGVATRAGVSMRHFVPVNGRSVRARFNGLVVEKEGSVALEGVYKLPRTAAAITLLISALFLLLAMALLLNSGHDHLGLQSWVGIVALSAVGLWLPSRVHYLYRSDIAWMNGYFRGALQ